MSENQTLVQKFRCCILQNFPFIEEDFDSLTTYELICKVVEYLNNTITQTNNNTLQVQELAKQFNKLKEYIDNYFANLDVQDEIDNKLNEMAVSGELQEIITAYLQVNGILAFNNIEEMKVSTNLLNGSFAETYGFYEKNDGGNAKYKIREKINNEISDNITLIDLENGLVAELILEDTMSIKQFGAKGNGINDDTLYIQTALNNVNRLFVPATDNYYKITDNIELKSNQIIYGVGEKSKLLMPNNLVKTIFDIQNVNNIIIDNIKLCNESCQTSANPDLTKNIIIYGENVNNITIQNCFFENAYSKGIEFKRAKNINYINNIFKNATYEMVFLMQEVENFLVDNCIFDSIISTYINSYLFATGRKDTAMYKFSCRNITVKNSKFLNNPIWEGIDTHSCNGFIVENNYIENCNVGIMAQAGSTSPIMEDEVSAKNIIIKGNIMKCSKYGGSSYGIIVGTAIQNLQHLAENVVIKDNIIEEFGTSK